MNLLASNDPWYELASDSDKCLLEKDELALSGVDVEAFLSHRLEKNTEVDWDKLAEVLTWLDAVLRNLEKDIESTRNTFSGVLQIKVKHSFFSALIKAALIF